MNQQAVEAWIAQNGGAGAVQYATEQKSIKNPDFDPYDPSKGAQYINIPVETWKNSKTGATLSVKRNDGGDFDVWENTGADPNKTPAGNDGPPGGKPYIDEEGPNGRRLGWNPATKQYDRDLGSSPSAQAAAQGTSKREPVQGKPGVYLVTTVKNGQTETHYEDEQGTRVATPAEAPKPVNTNTTEPFIVQAGPDGKITTTPNPNYVGEKPQRSTVKGGDGRTYIVTVDKDGKATAAPVEGLPADGTPAEPAGAPPASTQYGDMSASLVRYRDFLNQQVQNKTLTPDQADKLMDARLAQAKSTQAEQQGVVNTQTGIYGQNLTQRGQDINETASRRGDANSAYATVLSNYLPLLKFMPRGGGEAFAQLLAAGMQSAQSNAENWGGLKDTPNVTLGPAATAANQTQMPGQDLARPWQTPAAAAPAAAAPATDPAAGAAPAAATPTQGTFLAPYNPPAAAPSPQATALPPGRPDQTQVGSQIDNALMPPQAASSGSPDEPMTVASNGMTFTIKRSDWDSWSPEIRNQYQIVPATPPTPDTAPIFSPQPGNPAAAETPPLVPSPERPQMIPFNPPENPTPGIPVGMAPSFLAPYQQPRRSALDHMVQDEWMPNHLIAEAYQQVYGVPMPGSQAA